MLCILSCFYEEGRKIETDEKKTEEKKIKHKNYSSGVNYLLLCDYTMAHLT